MQTRVQTGVNWGIIREQQGWEGVNTTISHHFLVMAPLFTNNPLNFMSKLHPKGSFRMQEGWTRQWRETVCATANNITPFLLWFLCCTVVSLRYNTMCKWECKGGCKGKIKPQGMKQQQFASCWYSVSRLQDIRWCNSVTRSCGKITTVRNKDTKVRKEQRTKPISPFDP